MAGILDLLVRNLELSNDSKSLARSGKWKIEDLEVETPLMFTGYYLKSKPLPWEYCDVDGLLISAFEILRNASEREKIESTGLRDYLMEISGRQSRQISFPILLDSGGFSLLRRSRKRSTEETLAIMRNYMNRYMTFIPNTGATIAVALDFPIDPRISKNEIDMRLNFTAECLQEIMNSPISEEIPIMPVVHPYKGSIKKFLELTRPLLESSRLIGIGSMVPLIQHRGGSRKDVIDTVKELRKLFEDKLLHVFGIGGTTTMHTMLMLGADSLDSIAWRKRAAYGIIQLPGIGDRYLVKERKMYMAWKGIKTMSDDEVRSFLSCDCDACQGLLDEMIWRDLTNWVTTREKQTRRKIERAFKRIKRRMVGESKLLRFENQKKILEDLEHVETWITINQSDSAFLKRLIVAPEDFSDLLSNLRDKARSGNEKAIEQYLWLADKSFSWRAIHNLFTYKEEISRARKAIQEGNFTSFYKKRLEKSAFYKLVSGISN